jgi:hypothetical protein
MWYNNGPCAPAPNAGKRTFNAAFEDPTLSLGQREEISRLFAAVMTNALETYLEELRAIRSSGAAVKETSGYGVLANLFNAVGGTLKPKVRCFIHVKNSGAGLPDGGLFTSDQLKNTDEEAPLLGIPLPARGVIEVKAADAEIDEMADTKQVRDYVKHYGLVLLTNYRRFLLLKRGGNGSPMRLESFQLAPDESAFWRAAAQPRKSANELGERFSEYLKRVLLTNAELNNPKDVAFFLASYARTARVSVEAKAGLPALVAVRGALEEALGMKFEAEKGEHFFRSTLVQTLFYGVFSAWVLWHKEKPQRKNDFDWKSAVWTLHVPMIKALFEQVATPTKLGPLGLVEVLDWTANALNRVDRAAFFEKFLETHAVQYFYEPFLEAFDPKLRKQLGVWYTPPEIVQYQVARVDAALRDELDIPDGLADPRVFVLDPCCGTGAYLVEVLRKIEKTLKEEKGEGALAELTIKEAAQKRVFGFEIMPAPFVVAHLQMGLLLQNLAVPLDDAKGERAGIFLTNALTGWDEDKANPHLANWPDLETERRGAGKIKQEKPILVILGNPPYNGFAGVSPKEEQGLVEVYKGIYSTQKKNKDREDMFDEDGQPVMERHYRLSDSVSKGGWGIRKFNLDELYVRFFRIAERRIAEKTGRGIVSFISNHSWISDPSFVVLRQHLHDSFDEFWIENMHGDRKISEYAPNGRTSQTVFAMAGFSPGIKQGVAISLWIKTGKKRKKAVKFRDDLNDAKAAERRAHLLQTLSEKDFKSHYKEVEPTPASRFSFRPANVSTNYLGWPLLTELCSVRSDGFFEKRGGALIDIDRTALERRMRDYYDPNISWDEMVALKTPLTQNASDFDAKNVRPKVQGREKFDPTHIRPYALRPFETRWCYYSDVSPLWNRSRPILWQQCWDGNSFLVSRLKTGRTSKGSPIYFSTHLVDGQIISVNPKAFPIRLRSGQYAKTKQKNEDNGELGNILKEAVPAYKAGDEITIANLSPAARAYLDKLGIKNPDADEKVASLIWMHSLATGFSPAYSTENADGIQRDWPRIPLPRSLEVLIASAELGKQVASLLATEMPVEGVTIGKIKSEFKEIAVLSSTKNLSITAGFGRAGKGGIITAGKGMLVTKRLEVGPNDKLPWLEFHDVYLNDFACWKGIPAPVWDYTIGGYQVIKKWLSYREFDLLARALTPDEAREVTHMARRIAALILLQPELDNNYAAVKSAAAEWSDFSTTSK